MKTAIIGMIALLFVLGCAGKSVVGKWTYSIVGQNFVLELKDDKTFTMGSSSTSLQAGTYTYEDDKVTLNPGSSGQTMTFNLSKDGKKLMGSLGPMNVEFVRNET
jgi:hypothetical protein